MTEVRRLLRLCHPMRWKIALGVLLSVIVILSNVALMAVSGWFITAMALAGLGKMTLEFFTPAAGIRGLALLRSGARYLERLVSHDATLAVLARLRPWFYKKLVPLAPARLQGLRHGDLLARIRSDIDALDTFHLRILGPGLAALISSVIIVAAFALVSPGVAVMTALGLLLAGVAVPLLVRRATLGAGSALSSARAELQSGTGDLTRGFEELRVLNATGAQIDRLRALSLRLIAAQRRPAWAAAAGTALTNGVGQAMTLGAALILLPGAAAGEVSGPIFAMLVLGAMASVEAVSSLPGAFAAWDATLASARRIFALTDQTPAVSEPAMPETPRGNAVRFEDVHFAYDGGSPVLDGFDLTLQEGRCLALTGPTGAGKSTVLALLQRFHDPDRGFVSLGGTDLRRIADATLRQRIAVVEQQVQLFNATIAENLRLARPDADEDRLWQVLEQAQLAAEIRAMPEGLKTRLGELGTRLSGGQARRLGIARALLVDAPVLLLDEPTEGLDSATEAQVIAALATLIRGRTVLLVTHRPQALALADRQVVIGGARA
ncbi:thiol reductant ABC exporter subunit CydC [Pseudooceanicola sp. CBS1P-1]|uniref:Thiol reductant ABC exporter subunit CydC n=1 Tax=Pseudooceanicola albus TaxID=2692189 RepID=A0A6L7G9E1_9RHOB|nr:MULTISPECIES: thiol reductant ABC exporter subunit CydC [Pseudooceanicola]MBT9382859.1 thiol reductant ABC exporter subunit CydC [Pseudooceanicola endophyticus]MXN20217.1 thiol reductant ABC exporter subunit CydC [Pseudooceanicola albus]